VPAWCSMAHIRVTNFQILAKKKEVHEPTLAASKHKGHDKRETRRAEVSTQCPRNTPIFLEVKYSEHSKALPISSKQKYVQKTPVSERSRGVAKK